METVDMRPSGMVLNIEKGQWHSLRFCSYLFWLQRRPKA